MGPELWRQHENGHDLVRQFGRFSTFISEIEIIAERCFGMTSIIHNLHCLQPDTALLKIDLAFKIRNEPSGRIGLVFTPKVHRLRQIPGVTRAADRDSEWRRLQDLLVTDRPFSSALEEHLLARPHDHQQLHEVIIANPVRWVLTGYRNEFDVNNSQDVGISSL